MIIVAERINSSRKPIKEAIERKDTDFIKKEALRQEEAGADFIDINCGTFLDKEASIMEWLIENVQGVVKAPLCIDSPSSDVIKAALKLCRRKPAIINSITAERKRTEEILPLVKEHDAFVIALTMDERGIPKTADDRVKMAEKILKFAEEYGVNREKIYFDPLVQPVSSEQEQGKILLDAIAKIKNLGGTKTICGLSNVSFGLPDRSLINSTFLAMCIAAGLDAAVIDPLDKKLMSTFSAALVLTGEDRYSMKYIRNFRKSKLGI